MTAEIAIINPNAVALAADSAVTIGDKKIYNSALKLFTLSKVAPVGIMIYGSATMLGMPWETIIKLFRNHLGSKTFATLEEYSSNFLEFLTSDDAYFPLESQVEWIRDSTKEYFIHVIRERFYDGVKSILKEKGEISSNETTNLLSDLILDQHRALNDIPLIKGMFKTFEKDCKSQFKTMFAEIFEEVFEDITLDRSVLNKLFDIAVFIHTRQIFSGNQSGIVIAGFGEK